MSAITQQTIDQLVSSKRPERLSLIERPPITDDHASHVLLLAGMGQSCLAADHLLFPETNGSLTRTVSGLIRQLSIQFAVCKPFADKKKELIQDHLHARQYAYEVLMEMALNFCGLESRWLDGDEKKGCLRYLHNTLQEWEGLEREEGTISIASAVVKKSLEQMKRVQKGNSMVARTSLRIEAGLDFQKDVVKGFLARAESEIKGNIYYKMVKEGMCKFGNDYALGLRWLRHLGFEQVSTNPVLAARAYQDEPGLIEIFREEIKRHPSFRQWSSKPSRYGEEITLFATLLALWENLHTFRPIFFNLRETSGGGVVSFQLNPNIAHLVEESTRDVFKAFSLASENLSVYDRYLLAGYALDREKGRPNMVIKVAATTAAARTITKRINSFGFGSNITVDYTVSQEATLILEEMEGMARAIRKGIRPTQLYMTNMGGRLESHLRETKLEQLFHQLKEKIGEQAAADRILRLSEMNGTKEKVSAAKTFEEKVVAVTRFANQKTINEPVFDALRDVASPEVLQSWEEAIGKSGTLVARRVWQIFFSEISRQFWIAYLAERKGLNREEASWIMDRIHYLPASKRKPFDTYWTLSSRNLVHTEFPDHQENVRKMAETSQFNLRDYEESISAAFPPEVVEQLNKMEDFRKAYEGNPELAATLKEAGISAELGQGGLTPADWPTFGPVQKTLAEFKAAYDGFLKEMVSSLGKPARKPKKKVPVKQQKKPLKKRR